MVRTTCIMFISLGITASGLVVPQRSALANRVTSPRSEYSTLIPMHMSDPSRGGGNSKSRGNNKSKAFANKPKKMTIADLREELLKDPKQLQGKNKKAKKPRRTRSRPEQPQQTYMYAAQRKKLQQEGKWEGSTRSKDKAGGEDEEEGAESVQDLTPNQFDPLAQARELGLVNAANQHADVLIDDNLEPEIVGRLKVADESGSGAYAYLINKPAGWSILGSNNPNTNNSNPKSSKADDIVSPSGPKSKKIRQRVKIKGGDGSDEYLEFNEADVFSLLSPEEQAEWKAQGALEFDGPVFDDSETFVDIPGWYDVAQMSEAEREEAGIEEEDFDPVDIPDFNEADMLALMSPEDIEEYQQEKTASALQFNLQTQNAAGESKKSKNPLQRYLDMSTDEMDPKMLENLNRIEKRLKAQSEKASFTPTARPSVVGWLKEYKAAEGTPIRGGKFWTALAGATGVDDSGLVLLCPKAHTSQVFVDYALYVAVVGNGEHMAPPPKKKSAAASSLDIPKESIDMEIVSKVRKGREGDTCQTVRVGIAEATSTCSSVVQHAQDQFADGIRGDPASDPFDRRAPRRLIHCQGLSVSSLAFDEDVQAEVDDLPDDIAILANRMNQHKYKKGSFLGRSSLSDNGLTTAYREINGAADGFPGWTVDRYADWLLVQHDPKEYKGPLPSIHDGKTTGVYYLSSNPDRSAMGTDTSVRPTLLEGKAAPETVAVKENGVVYHVSLDRDLSTGIFLDQRPQRAWLTRNCNEKTHVLNCFAHCGAFSIAAATAGASTVSLDLNKKWLDRVEPQLEANGIPFDERHDCIYGDCFDWLEKLNKRGEKFDIVIVDPPSSSVGKKKKRWSVKNDMDELVSLAAPLVKKGGLLWTTTNSAGLSPVKFARLCKRGLDNVGLESAKLERIQPMPVDFPSIGSQPVKNLVWRIP